MKKPVNIRRKSPVGKIVALALAVLLLIAGSVWGVRETVEARRAAANLAEVQQLREQFKPEMFKEMTDEQRREFFKEYREKSKKLTFEQRKKLFAERARKEQERYNEYFNAPEDQRAAILARQMAERGNRRGAPGGKDNANGSSAKGNNPNGAGQGNGTSTDNQAMSREQRRREYLDMTTPDQRAQRSAYRQAMREQQSSGGR